MDNVYLLVAIVGAIGFLVTGVTGIIQATVALPAVQPQHRKWLYCTIIAFFVVSVIFGGATYLTARSSNTIATSAPVSGSPSPTLSTTATSAPVSGSLSPTATSAPTSNDYYAAHPGPGCDTNGGMWTVQGLNNITCSTWVSNITTDAWGYLYLQLPNNAAFAANNKISITFSNIDSLNNSCFGLAEQDKNTGYLVAYCVNGTWSINSISNQGAVIRTQSNNSTSIRGNTTLSIAFVNNTLIFAIDAESHQISISPIQPTKVAIAFYDNGCGNCSAVATNFNYITPAD